ncbi:sulfite exporter TauE/SafE family protein [Pseudescherichia sp.]|uniref:sulfite exporter TauE/SafE family protein n=1 Tax=Pseudescherichia sp. TaxID=2055881 RepID=UPI0028A93546|nr:sulfite exporter TauE/SafE family protein [Pseudescherichia sp.]
MNNYSMLILFIECFCIGGGLGYLDGLLGIGGGIIAIPILAWLFQMDQQLAQGTVLVMIIPNLIMSVIHYRRRNDIRLKKIIPVCILSSIFSAISSTLAIHLDAKTLNLFFCAFILLLAFYYLYAVLKRGASRNYTLPESWLPVTGAVCGLMSGLFTVGGGMVIVPLLVALFSYSQTRAQGTALALVLPGAFTALISYAFAGHVAWSVGLPMAMGAMFTVASGVALAHRLPTRMLKMCFCMMLFFVALSA